MEQITEARPFMGTTEGIWGFILRQRAVWATFAALNALLFLTACGDDAGTDPFCGDGIVQRANEEECDDGKDNGVANRCSPGCTFNEGFCVFDAAKACGEGVCGNFISHDTCGRMAWVNCGACADVTFECVDNKCVPKASEET